MIRLKTRGEQAQPRVLLVNMPLATIQMPSLALGLLKAELTREGFACEVLYLNVLVAQMVGWDVYGVVERSSALLAGEQMFASELFGNRIPPDHEYDANVFYGVEPEVQQRVRHFRVHVHSFLENCLTRIPWGEYDVIGFSSVFEQNVPSLNLARRVKERFTQTAIVFGGANCGGIMGITLHRCFPFVDFVITGEADAALPQLITCLTHGCQLSHLPGVVSRHSGATVYGWYHTGQ